MSLTLLARVASADFLETSKARQTNSTLTPYRRPASADFLETSNVGT